MPYCSSCGSEIPEGQGSSCSMCYGDISYGTDGYYAQWAEEQLAIEIQKQEQEQLDAEKANNNQVANKQDEDFDEEIEELPF